MRILVPARKGGMNGAHPGDCSGNGVRFARPAIAEDKAVKVVQEADKVVVRKRTVIDFNDVTVEGELTRPEGSYVLDRNRTRFRR